MELFECYQSGSKRAKSKGKIKTAFHSLLTYLKLHLCHILLSLDQEKHKHDPFLTSEGCGKGNYANMCKASGVCRRGPLQVLISLL